MTSRRLDALFAERVLNRSVQRHLMLDEEGNGWLDLPHFTQSLDAAWEGVEKIRAGENGAYRVELVWDAWEWDAWEDGRNGSWTVEIGVDPCCVWSQSARPALAIVKACLFAAGVSQEEIDEAAKE